MRINTQGDSRTRVLLTVLHLFERNGRVTMRETAEGAGLSLTATKRHLDALRDEGLVGWDPDTSGTLRPLVEVVR